MSTRRTDEDFAAEVQAHLDLEIARLVADGMSPADARAAAMRSFGNVAAVQERFYEATAGCGSSNCPGPALRPARAAQEPGVRGDHRLHARRRPQPADRRLHHLQRLRAAAVRGPRPAAPWTGSAGARTTTGIGVPWRDYEALRDRRDLFDAVVAEDTRFLSSDGRTLLGGFVSDNYFEALAPRMLLGRALGAADARAPSPSSATRPGRGCSRRLPPSSAASSISTGAGSRSSACSAGVHRARRLSARPWSRCRPTPRW